MRRSRKMNIYPWDLSGYVKLSWGGKQRLIQYLISEYKTIRNINNKLGLPTYWFNNFKRNDKVDTKELKRIVSITNLDLVDDIIQFNDDSGASSIPFLGKFPIKYNPLWHFLFCLSIGDGHIKKDDKRHFIWYQKSEGQIKLIKLLSKINFNYNPSVKGAKQGVTVPQLVRKIGSFVTCLDSSQSIKQNIFDASAKLGKDFELALLCAFFIDEAGMRKSRSNSEITLHQEGNLHLLEKIGELLTRFNIGWSKNKKGDKWCIRINLESVVHLSKLFVSLKKYGIDLLHREEIFQNKVKKAREMLYMVPLKKESILIRKYLLDNYNNKTITFSQIKSKFNSNFNVSARTRKLVSTMKLKNELQSISLGKYLIKVEQK